MTASLPLLSAILQGEIIAILALVFLALYVMNALNLFKGE